MGSEGDAEENAGEMESEDPAELVGAGQQEKKDMTVIKQDVINRA
jgi:hypothetical protein